jgi:dipeptidyl aminopeptidase/acylaminoacyl peptidase
VSFSTEVESFQTADGVRLRLTRRSTGRQRAVLVVPGIFMHRESAEHRLLAERLAAVADVLTLDVRGHGDSGGAFSFGLREPEDVAQVAAWLRTRYPRVGGLGFSFGGYHTAVAAARHRPFDAVALVAAPRRLFLLDHNFLTRGLLRSLPWTLGRERRPTRLSLNPFGRRAVPSLLVDGIAPTPLLILHGTDDWLIPVAHARELYARAREPKTLQLLEGQLHAEAILARDPEALLAPLLRFFEDRL